MRGEMIKVKVWEGEEKSEFEVRRSGLGVLKGLERWGVLSLSQIEGLVFGKASGRKRLELFFNGRFKDEYRGAAYKVLERLVKRGLVMGQSYVNLTRVYSLTRKGHAALVESGLAGLEDYRDTVSDSMIRHELLVSGIGLVISELIGLPVATNFEHQILKRGEAGQGSPSPDLWVSIGVGAQPLGGSAQSLGGGSNAIEVERSLKSAERYQGLWELYRYYFSGGGVVLYITAWPGLSHKILSLARKFLMDFIYVCPLEDFRKSLGKGAFVNYRGEQFSLGRPQSVEPLSQGLGAQRPRPEHKLALGLPR